LGYVRQCRLRDQECARLLALPTAVIPAQAGIHLATGAR
jgi:hypothetical protein